MVKIGNKIIGDDNPCFITFEAGPTHNGIESAKRLIKYAAESGADAIKFQIFDPEKLVADKNQLFSFGVLKNRETGEIENIEKPLYDILKERCLKDEEWRQVKKYSDEFGLAFFATVGFDKEIELLEELSCDSIKIASADVNHYPLLRRAAKTGMCIQLDTGMSTVGEIESAVDIITKEGNENIIIHHCPSGYPARLEGINLNVIPALKRMFPYPIAFSDHTPGYTMDIASVALGANLVEKTITENRMTRAVEHVMSIEPDQMKNFVKTIREVETALGSSRRKLHDSEKEKRNQIRRSVFLLSDAQSGQKLNECDVEFRRPGFGISPDQFELISNAILRNDCKAGQIIRMSDLEFK